MAPQHPNLPKTNHRIAAEFAAGVLLLLADQAHGRRSMRWLAEQVNIAYPTLRYRLLQSPRNFTFVDHEDIANALGTTVADIIKLGAADLDAKAA
jgi:hypothetical protein